LCFEKLGLSSDKSPTISELNRAYRKAALKVHPDKGGDMVEV
jgi:curved DNA-binding protein CbpA